MNSDFLALNMLISIQDKHHQYFSDNNLTILACAFIVWENPVRVYIFRKLPDNIKADIEAVLPLDSTGI